MNVQIRMSDFHIFFCKSRNVVQKSTPIMQYFFAGIQIAG